MPSPNPWEPENFHKSYSSGVSPNEIPTLQFYQSERWMKWYALKKWESTLSFCSCPWKRCRPSQELLAKWFFYLNNSFGVNKFDPLQLWFRPCYPYSIYLEEIHSRASSIFDKVKISSVVCQRPSSTTIMFCLRVLPSGISRISCLCTSSY